MPGLELFDNIVNDEIQRAVIEPVVAMNFSSPLKSILSIQEQLHANIPDNKRISYGRYYTVKILGQRLYTRLVDANALAFDFAVYALEHSNDFIVRGVALEMISQRGLGNLEDALSYFKAAAADEHWDMREFASGFFRKLVKAHPQGAREFYLELVKSQDPFLHRFVSESLRPVSENRWLRKDPEYALSILQHLFREPAAYARTSVGNNLSDWSRLRPDLVYPILEDLISYRDKNSYWIAYRACRNLVKKEPLRVMDLLGIDEYKYKDRVHKREDYR
jgi:3-methyladenine DNA glycosylase AlkC